MKFLALFLCFTASLLADSFTLENKTSFQKIAIQWASCARVAQESNDALLQGELPKGLYYPKKVTAKVKIPSGASYFRLLVWESKEKNPTFLTNWVVIVPDKTYLIDDEHLTPILLLNGMGC